MKYLDRTKLLANLKNPVKQRAYRAEAKRRRGGTLSNACGCTGIQPYIDLGYTTWAAGFDFNKNGWPLAENVTDWIERYFAVERITDWREVRAGDLIKCLDRHPANGFTDHIWHALSDPDKSGRCLCFDNQSKLGRTPYLRSLTGSDGKTAMLYAIRFLEKPL